MKISFENHCVSNSPSKIEGAGGSMKLSRKEIILLRVASRQLLYLRGAA